MNCEWVFPLNVNSEGDYKTTYTAVINNVDNDGELAAVLAVVDEDKTTDLNLTLEWTLL